MSFIREATRDKPIGLYNLDSATGTFLDYSGYGRNANQVGSTAPRNHMGIVSGAAFGPVLTPTTAIGFPVPLFKRGQESESFTLGLWVRVTTPGNRQQLLSNFGQYDGLCINGNVVSFGTTYVSGASATVSYDVQQARSLHVVGVHTASKNSLYIDGVLVGEVSLSNIAANDRYASTGNNSLFSGGTSSNNQSFVINGVAMYSAALPPENIMRHYIEGTTNPTGEEVPAAYGGVKIPLSLSNANIFLDQWWTTEQDWTAASLFNVAITDGRIRPQFDDGISLPGQWLDSFALDSVPLTSIYGVSANWDGIGMTVEVSLDGNTWETVKRGANIAMIPAGFNPTDKVLQIRIKFAGGVFEDPAFVDNLNFVGLTSATSPQVAGRSLILTKAYQEREYPNLRLHDNWGVEIVDGGAVQITDDTLEAVPMRTVEMWFKPTTGNFGTNFSGGTFYTNGAPGINFAIGEWCLLHWVTPSPVTGSIFINNGVQVGMVAIYPTALSTAEVQEIYGQYTGTSVKTIVETTPPQITETPPTAIIYAYDWSISPTG